MFVLPYEKNWRLEDVQIPTTYMLRQCSTHVTVVSTAFDPLNRDSTWTSSR